MPTHRIVPAEDQDIGEALSDAIDALEAEGAEITNVIPLDQPLPRKPHWLIVTANRVKIEKRG